MMNSTPYWYDYEQEEYTPEEITLLETIHEETIKEVE